MKSPIWPSFCGPLDAVEVIEQHVGRGQTLGGDDATDWLAMPLKTESMMPPVGAFLRLQTGLDGGELVELLDDVRAAHHLHQRRQVWPDRFECFDVTVDRWRQRRRGHTQLGGERGLSGSA